MNTLEMTSREIAELTGKRHCEVLRDVRLMADKLATQICVTKFSNRGKDHCRYGVKRDSPKSSHLSFSKESGP